MLKVLIVEDETERQGQYRRALKDKVLIISAFDIQEAEEHFTANSDLAAIIMDACVPGDTPTTLGITAKFRETFSGPMIAASGDPYYRQKLVASGCDHQAPKDLVVQKLLEILGI